MPLILASNCKTILGAYHSRWHGDTSPLQNVVVRQWHGHQLWVLMCLSLHPIRNIHVNKISWPLTTTRNGVSVGIALGDKFVKCSSRDTSQTYQIEVIQ